MVIGETLVLGLCNTLGTLREEMFTKRQWNIATCGARRAERATPGGLVDLSHYFLRFDNIGFRTFSNPDFPEQTNLRRPRPRAIFLSEMSMLTNGRVVFQISERHPKHMLNANTKKVYDMNVKEIVLKCYYSHKIFI